MKREADAEASPVAEAEAEGDPSGYQRHGGRQQAPSEQRTKQRLRTHPGSHLAAAATAGGLNSSVGLQGICSIKYTLLNISFGSTNRSIIRDLQKTPLST